MIDIIDKNFIHADILIENSQGKQKWFSFPHYALDAIIFAGDDPKKYTIVKVVSPFKIHPHASLEALDDLFLYLRQERINTINDLANYWKKKNLPIKNPTVQDLLNAYCISKKISLIF